MLERDFQRRLMNRFKDFGWLEFKIHGHAMQRSGWPDLFVCGVGLPDGGMWIELKTDTGTVSEIQKLIIGRMRARRVPVLVLRPTECRDVVWTEPAKVVGEYLATLAKQQLEAGK